MKKITFKGVMNSLQDAAMDGAVIYAGSKAYEIIDHQVTKLLPSAIPVQLHGPVVGALGVIAGDMLLPMKYRRIFGAAMASEVIFDLVDTPIEAALVKANLVAPPVAGAAAGYGRVTNGYARMGGFTSMRGGMFPTLSVTGLPN